MKDKIFVLLDELVSMSGSLYTTESLNLELGELDKKITKIKDNIKKKNLFISENNYLNLSEQMVDRNLQISLEQRLNTLQNSIDDLNGEIQNSLGKEQENYKKIQHLEKEIKESQNLIASFNYKKQKATNKEVKNTYESLILDENKKLDEEQSLYDNANKEKNQITEELQCLSDTNNEHIDDLKETKDRLNEIKIKLANEKNYYDYDSEQKDNRELSEMSQNLDELESKRLVLLTNPANLASEAKKMLVQEDWNNAIAKIKELITVLKSVPFINETDDTKLKENYDNVKAKIDSMEKEIENKSYDTVENDVIVNRVAYLTEIITNFEGKSKSIKEIVDDIDNKMVLDLKNEIDNSIIQKNGVKGNLEELKRLSENDDSVELLASIMAYQKELESIEEIIDGQSEDLERLVDFSAKLESEFIDRINDRILADKKIIKELERQLSLKAKFKDEKAKLQDAKELNKLKLDLKLIENSMKFNKTPDEIYNEIDVLMGSIDFDVPVIRERKKSVLPSNRDIDTNGNERLKVIDIIPINPVKKDNKEITNEEENNDDIPPLNTNPSDIGFNDLVDYIGGA
jgi:hypothetical protein